MHIKEGCALAENYQIYSIVKTFFFFFLNAGMEGEGGFTRASWKRSRERGSESFVLNDYLSEQDRPILPNRDCPRRKKLPRGFTMFAILGQCQQWSLKKRQMTVRTKRR